MVFEYFRRREFILNRAYRKVRNRLFGKPPGDMVDKVDLILLHFIVKRYPWGVGGKMAEETFDFYMSRKDISTIDDLDLVVTHFLRSRGIEEFEEKDATWWRVHKVPSTQKWQRLIADPCKDLYIDVYSFNGGYDARPNGRRIEQDLR